MTGDQARGLFARLDDVELTIHADGSGHVTIKHQHTGETSRLELSAAELQSLNVLLRTLR